MQKRFIVIADYPDSIYTVGTVLDREGSYDSSNNVFFYNKYPHLFRELSWWEHREISDFPEYVKYSTKGKIIKVKWIYVQDGEGKVQLENGGYRFTWSFNLFEPATESQYNEYLKIKP